MLRNEKQEEVRNCRNRRALTFIAEVESERPDDSDHSGSGAAPEMPWDLQGEETSPGCHQGCSSLLLLPDHGTFSHPVLTRLSDP